MPPPLPLKLSALKPDLACLPEAMKGPKRRWRQFLDMLSDTAEFPFPYASIIF